jgi:hypothetical protein
MVFTSPAWVPALPFDPPDSISLHDFVMDESYGRFPEGKAQPPVVCGLSGKAYSVQEVRERVDFLSRSLANRLGWQAAAESAGDKVVGIFSANTVREHPTRDFGEN